MTGRLGDAFVRDAVRTPIGRYGGALAAVRTDDLAAVPIRRGLDRLFAPEAHLGVAERLVRRALAAPAPRT